MSGLSPLSHRVGRLLVGNLALTTFTFYNFVLKFGFHRLQLSSRLSLLLVRLAVIFLRFSPGSNNFKMFV